MYAASADLTDDQTLLADQLGPAIPDRPFFAQPAPLLPPAAAMAAGIAVDHWISPPIAFYVVIVALALVAIFFRRRRGIAIASMVVSAFALGGIMHDSCFRRGAADHVVRYVSDDPIFARLTGVVRTEPRLVPRRDWFFSRWAHGRDKTRFILDTRLLDGTDGPIAVSGLVGVRVDGPVRDVHAGDLVRIAGYVRRPGAPTNPGSFDYALWQRRNGIRVTMRCESAALASVESPNEQPWREHLQSFRVWARSMLIDESAASADAEDALIETMILGRRRAIDAHTERIFMRTGATHYLSVSGTHVGVVAWIVWYFGRKLGGTRRHCAVAAAIAIALYVCLVDPDPPVIRSAIIGFVFCLGALLRRTTNMPNSISLAAIILLCIRPTALFEPGFQMSFAGVYALCYLTGPLLYTWARIEERIVPPRDHIGVLIEPLPLKWLILGTSYRSVRNVFAACVAACLVSTPIMSLHFGRIAPLAFVTSPILIPFFSAMVFAGFAGVILGFLSPATLAVTQPIAHGTSWMMLRVVEMIDRISPEYRGGWAVVFLLVYFGIVATLLIVVPIGGVSIGRRFTTAVRSFTSPGGVPSSVRRFSLIVVALSAVAGVAVLFVVPSGKVSLRVTHLAVGRGTACVIEFPDGRAWLYDCGTNGDYDVGESTVAAFCRYRGIGRIDRILISHPNMDHFSGVFGLADHVPVKEISISRYFADLSHPGGSADAMLNETRRRGIALSQDQRAGVADHVGDVLVETLWPPDDGLAATDSNDTSIVIRLTYGGGSILMCGDIEQSAIAALLDRGDLSADVLVLPHHGSVERNTAAFIQAVNPSLCIRSTSQPMDEASPAQLDALNQRPVLNTADEGTVTIDIRNGENLRMWSFRDPFPRDVIAHAE